MALIIIGFGWVAGLVAVGAFGAPWWMGGAWAAASAPVLLASGWVRGRRLPLVTAVVFALVSGWWLDRSEIAEPEWLVLRGAEVTLSGRVASEPNRGEITTGYMLEVDSLRGEGAAYSGGLVLVFLHQYEELLPGDRVVVSGELEEPPRFEGFDYRAYLARQGIFATMFRPRVLDRAEGDASVSRWLTGARLSLDESLQRALPAPEAALAAGIAFGRDDQLSEESKEAFNRSGLRHLVAVSGSNVSLVALLTYFLAVPAVGRKWAWLPAAFTIAAYLCAAGLSASVFRAGIMAAVLLGGRAIGRPQSGLPALFAAVIAMTLLDPRLALDAGFQLSATATAGIICLSPWLQHWLLRATAAFPAVAPPRFVAESLAVTTAASISTAPVMWVTFDQISVVSPLANAIVQPVFAIAFWMSLATAVLGLLADELGRLGAMATYYPLAFIESVASAFGSRRWAAVVLPGGSAAWATAAYAVLAAVALAAYRFQPVHRDEPRPLATGREFRRKVVVAAAGGAAVLAIVPISLFHRGGPGELQMAFLDIGQGDATLVTTPGGKQVLVDGGPSGVRVAGQLAAVMPHWDRSLDAIILTHPQEDHVAGLVEVVRRFEVGAVYGNGFRNATTSFELFEENAGETSVLRTGDNFELDGVRFEVLWPDSDSADESDLNNTSLVVRITYGETSVLLTGDSEGPVHEVLEQRGQLRADVLKVPHHGSQTTPAWFFGAVGPAVAVISAGEGNIFGHPHHSTVEALAGVRLYRTDTDGRITVKSDGSRLAVSSER